MDVNNLRKAHYQAVADKKAGPGGKTSNEKRFARGQVQMHRSMNDCWVIIHNKIYDVTQFINQHPGGSRVFLDWAGTGKDAGGAFDDAMHG